MVLDSIETFFPNSIGIGLLTGASNSKLTNKFGFYRGVSLNYSRLVGSNDKLFTLSPISELEYYYTTSTAIEYMGRSIKDANLLIKLGGALFVGRSKLRPFLELLPYMKINASPSKAWLFESLGNTKVPMEYGFETRLGLRYTIAKRYSLSANALFRSRIMEMMKLGGINNPEVSLIQIGANYEF